VVVPVLMPMMVRMPITLLALRGGSRRSDQGQRGDRCGCTRRSPHGPILTGVWRPRADG